MITMHANCLRLDRFGILLMGESGTGKSSLTLSLIERCQMKKMSACLIADDYTDITTSPPFIYAHAPKAIAGKIEVYGAGLFEVEYQPNVRLTHAIKLGAGYSRYPDEMQFSLDGVKIPMLEAAKIGDGDIIAICQAIEAFVFRKKWV